MRARNLVWNTGYVCEVIVTVKGFVMAVGEGGKCRVGVGDGQLWLRLGILDGTIEARFKPELERIGPVAADTFRALKATTATVLACKVFRHALGMPTRYCGLTLGLALDLVFSAFAAAVALDVMRFGLSSISAVITLLDWSTLGGNMLKRTI